ncbi:MAG TPA: hypothetical protein VFP11_11335, partial [Candidatus Angelobacter sp.]|nr:hypothetical protein [Candidatus Angelobacter sp.]
TRIKFFNKPIAAIFFRARLHTPAKDCTIFFLRSSLRRAFNYAGDGGTHPEDGNAIGVSWKGMKDLNVAGIDGQVFLG